MKRRHVIQTTGAILLAGCTTQSKNSSPSKSIEFNNKNWTHPYHDPANTNHAPMESIPSNFTDIKRRWSVNGISSPSVAAQTNGLYATLQSNSGESLCRIDPDTGKKTWTNNLNDKWAKTTSIGVPTVNETTIYVNVQFDNGNKTKSYIYGIDPENGSTKWRTQIVADALIRLHRSGIAIITQQGPKTSRVQALDATTGDTLWQFPTKNRGFPFFNDDKVGYQEHSIPTTTIVDNTLYVPVVNDDKTDIHALDITSGETRKKYTVSVPVEFTLVAANGLLYGTSHSLIPETTKTSSVYAIDPEKEKLQWAKKTTDNVYWLGVSDRVVYFVDDGVRSFDALTGKELWHKDSESIFPAILGKYVPSSNPSTNEVYIREQETGQSVTKLSFGNDKYVKHISSNGGRLYIIKGDTLYAFS